MMVLLGLTGSIGMGKTTTAGLFEAAGVPVHDADAVVHALYKGPAVEAIGAAFPGALKEGHVDRAALAGMLAAAPEKFKILEAIVHPLVRAYEAEFVKDRQRRGEEIVLLDIPLLFESGADSRVDLAVVVSADPEVQRQRVLARPGMSEDKFQMILSRQMPDTDKRARADYIVDTGHGLDAARQQVDAILADVRQRMSRGEFEHA